MKVRSFAIRVELAEVDHELEVVMADLEVVGVAAFEFSGIRGHIAFLVHSCLLVETGFTGLIYLSQSSQRLRVLR